MGLPEKAPRVPITYNYVPALNEVVKAGKLKELSEIEDIKYYYWEKWKYMAGEWGIDPKHLWAVVKFGRMSNKMIQISLINGFTFTMGMPSVILEYLHEFDMHLGGSLQGESLIPSEEKERYLISSLMEEAIASSQLEGAATTRKVAKEMLESNRRHRNLSEQMIVNKLSGNAMDR